MSHAKRTSNLFAEVLQVVRFLVLPISVTIQHGLSGAEFDVVCTPTFENIGIEVRFSEPPPTGIKGLLYYKPADSNSDFLQGHYLVRTFHYDAYPGSDRLFCGSLFRLQPDTEYVIRIRFEDASGKLFVPEKTVRARTRRDYFPPASGTTWHVSNSGNDNNEGTAEDKAFRTLAKALTVVRPGDQIFIHSGVYHEGNLILRTSGTPDKPIVITGPPDRSAVLDGSDPAALAEMAWELYDQSKNIYRALTPLKPVYLYIVEKGTGRAQHLIKFVNFSAFLDDRWQGCLCCCYSGDYLYVRLPGGESMEEYTVILPKYSTCLALVDTSDVQIRNLELRFYGYGPNQYRTCAIGLYGTQRCLIEKCFFHHNPASILFFGDNGRIRDTVIQCP